MATILITEFMDERAVALLRGRHDVDYDPALVEDAARLARRARDCDVLVVRNRTQVRGPLLEALARCSVVGRLGVGLDNIDVAACKERGIEVIPATGANALSVAEYVVATAMVLLRGAYLSTAAVAAGHWPRAALGNGREMAGKTLGVVGFGAIGQLTARLARSIGMHVVAYDALLRADDPTFAAHDAAFALLDELVAAADVVSLHVPLVDSTRGLFSAQRIAAMKPGAVLVNTSRGGVVDERAVAQALREGRLGGAALDVFSSEPLPASGHFEGCPNLILTPHVAGVTAEANERVSLMIAERVLASLDRQSNNVQGGRS
jgi:(S)-sulfolactate dehydrogenase